MIKITLPMPPSVNQIWRPGIKYGKPHIYLSDAARNYGHLVKIVSRWCNPYICNVALEVYVYRPKNIGDIDNYLKVMLDNLQGGLYVNDKQITELHIYKRVDRDNPRVEVKAWPARELTKKRYFRRKL